MWRWISKCLIYIKSDYLNCLNAHLLQAVLCVRLQLCNYSVNIPNDFHLDTTADLKLCSILNNLQYKIKLELYAIKNSGSPKWKSKAIQSLCIALKKNSNPSKTRSDAKVSMWIVTTLHCVLLLLVVHLEMFVNAGHICHNCLPVWTLHCHHVIHFLKNKREIKWLWDRYNWQKV